MKIDNQILERIRKIKWFENCGKYDADAKTIAVDSWERARYYYGNQVWEDVTLEASNVLTQYLFSKYKKEYAEWNTLTDEAKLFIENEVLLIIGKYKDENGLDTIFIDCVKWDILGAIMEDSYQICHKRPTFFLELLSVYENGNYPCGWEGEWPEGKLVVF